MTFNLMFLIMKDNTPIGFEGVVLIGMSLIISLLLVKDR